MKHIFIINPTAGKKDISKKIIEEIKSVFKDAEYLVHITSAPLDAKNFVHEYCYNHPNDELRFYSCGGDGTLNEVVNGAFGYANASVTCYPSGSGNDFVKYFGKKDDFLNLENLINGQEVLVDLLKYEDRYVLNICNIGFDADVADRMIKYKRLPLVSGTGAYILGVAVSFIHRLSRDLKITVDDKLVYQGQGLLCAMANAICYGGGFYCAPLAKVNDGLLDVVAIKKMSRLKFIKFIKYYKNGTHLAEPRLQDYIVVTQGKTVTIESRELLNYAIDGEMGQAKKMSLTVVPQAIKFVIPNKQ